MRQLAVLRKNSRIMPKWRSAFCGWYAPIPLPQSAALTSLSEGAGDSTEFSAYTDQIKIGQRGGPGFCGLLAAQTQAGRDKAFFDLHKTVPPSGERGDGNEVLTEGEKRKSLAAACCFAEK